MYSIRPTGGRLQQQGFLENDAEGLFKTPPVPLSRVIFTPHPEITLSISTTHLRGPRRSTPAPQTLPAPH